MRVIALIPFGLACIVFAGISCIQVGRITCVRRWDLEAYNNRENLPWLSTGSLKASINSHMDDQIQSDSLVAQVLLLFAAAFAILNMLLWVVIMKSECTKEKELFSSVRSKGSHTKAISSPNLGNVGGRKYSSLVRNLGLNNQGSDFLIGSQVKPLMDNGEGVSNKQSPSDTDNVSAIIIGDNITSSSLENSIRNEKSRNIGVLLIFYLATSVFIGLMTVNAHMFITRSSVSSSTCINTAQHVFNLIGLTYFCALLDTLQ
eukprot:Nk52_evm1s2446 gene=Nk52_evmTU1s2446